MKLAELGLAEVRGNLKSNGICIAAYPFSFRIRSAYSELAESLAFSYANYELLHEHSLIDFDLTMRPVSGFRRLFRPLMRIEIDGSVPFDPLPVNQIYPLLEWGMNWCVTSSANNYVMCHSAVLAKGDMAIILPAPPGSGKSTLCAILMFSGWRLLSDEIALIDPDNLSVSPFVRPVSLKNGSIDLILNKFQEAKSTRKVFDTIKGTVAHFQPTHESLTCCKLRAQPRWLVFPKYQGDAELTVTPITKAEALVDLARNTFNLAALGPKALDALNGIIDKCDCLKLEYADVEDAVAFFDGLYRASLDGPINNWSRG